MSQQVVQLSKVEFAVTGRRSSTLESRATFMATMCVQSWRSKLSMNRCRREWVWCPGFSRLGALPAEAGTPNPEAYMRNVRVPDARPRITVETIHQPPFRRDESIRAQPARASRSSALRICRTPQVHGPNALTPSWWCSPCVGGYIVSAFRAACKVYGLSPPTNTRWLGGWGLELLWSLELGVCGFETSRRPLTNRAAIKRFKPAAYAGLAALMFCQPMPTFFRA